MSNSLDDLAACIAAGLDTRDEDIIRSMRSLFGERYHKRSARNLESEKPPFVRNAYGRGASTTEHVAYAAFINPEHSPSGPYGGFSFA